MHITSLIAHKKSFFLIILSIFCLPAMLYSMEEKVTIGLKDGSLELTAQQLEDFKGIIDKDVKEMLEQGGDIVLPSASKKSLEFVLKNLELIKESNREKLIATMQDIFEAETLNRCLRAWGRSEQKETKEFSALLNIAAYLGIDPVLEASKAFIKDQLFPILYSNPDFFKRILEVQNTHKAARFIDDAASKDLFSEAMKSTDEDLFTLLIDFLAGRKVNLNQKNAAGKTALIVAAEKGFFKAAEKLIQNKVDLNATDYFGSTALMIAAKRRENAAIVKLLIKNKADLNKQDHLGYTALMIAALVGDPEPVQALVDANADTTIKDLNGETALDLIKKRTEINLDESSEESLSDSFEFLGFEQVNQNSELKHYGEILTILE